MRWLVLASSQASKSGYGVLCDSVIQALGQDRTLQLDIFSGGQSQLWWPGRRLLKSEKITGQPWWFFFAAFDWLTLLLTAKGRHDGVFVMVEHYAVAGWLYSRRKKIPCVLIQCGTYAVGLPKSIPFFRHVLENTERILPISHYTCTRMREEGIKGQYATITLGVDRQKFSAPSICARRQEIVFVGNLKARKGLSFLLDAILMVQDKLPGIRLKIIGRLDHTSVAFQNLLKRIQTQKLNVEFTGELSQLELVEAYASSRLNALPSKSDPFYFEGFGLVHLEANACGTLTVGTLGSGNEDAIQDKFGYLVKYGDVDGLATVITEAMTLQPYPELPVERLRTWEQVAEDYINVFKEVLSKNSFAKNPLVVSRKEEESTIW